MTLLVLLLLLLQVLGSTPGFVACPVAGFGGTPGFIPCPVPGFGAAFAFADCCSGFCGLEGCGAC